MSDPIAYFDDNGDEPSGSWEQNCLISCITVDSCKKTVFFAVGSDGSKLARLVCFPGMMKGASWSKLDERNQLFQWMQVVGR
jgi:hypothetical protein